MYNSLIRNKLVEIKENDKIIIDMIYKKLGFKYAIDKCYLMPEVYKRLLEACKYLPDG